MSSDLYIILLGFCLFGVFLSFMFGGAKMKHLILALCCVSLFGVCLGCDPYPGKDLPRVEAARRCGGQLNPPFKWERIRYEFWERESYVVERAKVPGGWLVIDQVISSVGVRRTMCFVPDPDHAW